MENGATNLTKIEPELVREPVVSNDTEPVSSNPNHIVIEHHHSEIKWHIIVWAVCASVITIATTATINL